MNIRRSEDMEDKDLSIWTRAQESKAGNPNVDQSNLTYCILLDKERGHELGRKDSLDSLDSFV